MITFIIRRLFAAVLMLLVVSMVTFVVFFLVPRLAGQTTDQLAAQYVGKNPSTQQIHAMEVKLGLDAPLYVQYGRFVKGIVAGQTFNDGPDVSVCPAPCFGYSFKNQEPVWPQMMSALPVTGSLAAGAAIIWLVFGVGIGVLSALRRGTVFDRAAMTVALAGVSLPVFFTALLSLAIFRDTISLFPDAGTFIPFSQNPGRWAGALRIAKTAAINAIHYQGKNAQCPTTLTQCCAPRRGGSASSPSTTRR